MLCLASHQFNHGHGMPSPCRQSGYTPNGAWMAHQSMGHFALLRWGRTALLSGYGDGYTYLRGRSPASRPGSREALCFRREGHRETLLKPAMAMGSTPQARLW